MLRKLKTDDDEAGRTEAVGWLPHRRHREALGLSLARKKASPDNITARAACANETEGYYEARGSGTDFDSKINWIVANDNWLIRQAA